MCVNIFTRSVLTYISYTKCVNILHEVCNFMIFIFSRDISVCNLCSAEISCVKKNTSGMLKVCPQILKPCKRQTKTAMLTFIILIFRL